MIQLEELSKEVSYALRHAPWEYGLELDEEGWTSVEQLITALRRSEKWKNLCEADLRKMVEASQKKRHEIKDGKIRAFYGHSIPMKIVKAEEMPPDILYHGTARRFVRSIMESGLLPQGRQYVHLSEDIETAEEAGKRRDIEPCIMRVDAEGAWKDGIKFYKGNNNVWLADWIPGKYLTPMMQLPPK